MGFWDKLTGELVDIIEWLDDSSNTIVYRFERYGNEIKYGAKLIVRPSQVAVFVNEGKIADVYEPGTYTLETKNMPILSTLNGWMHGFNSPFKAEVYFINTKVFTDCKWGTKNPIMLRDSEFGAVRIRAFGTYAIRIIDPAQFVREIAGTSGHFTISQITDQLRNMIIGRFSNIIGKSKIPVLDLAANYDQLAEFIKTKLDPEFISYGVEINSFYIENISLPPAVEEAMDKRTSIGIIGNLNAYTEFQTANAIESAAKNPSGGSNAADALSMGVGLAMANRMTQGQSTNQQSVTVPTPPPMPEIISYHLIINNEKYGPYNINEIKNLVIDGKVTSSTLVWKQGMEKWSQAISQNELSSLFHSTPPLPPLPKKEKIYYVVINNNQDGPFNISEIEELIKQGKVNRETSIWKNGLSNWEKLEQLDELKNILASIPPTPPNINSPILNPPPVNKIDNQVNNISRNLETLIKGQKVKLSDEIKSNEMVVGINWEDDNCKNYEINISVLLLSERGKIEKENDFIFYNNLISTDNSVELQDNQELPFKMEVFIDINKISPDIEKILFVLNIDHGDELNHTCENVKDLRFIITDINTLSTGYHYKVEGLTKETAVMLAEIYKHNNQWRLQAIGNGFNKGLDSILNQYASENLNIT